MKLLVPIDGSQNSLKAVSHAAMLADKFKDSTITLVYVIMFEPQQRPMASSALVDTIGATKARANDALAEAEKMLEGYTISYDKVIERGSNAADKIIEIAEKDQYSAIVMGSRGLSNIKRFLMGSVSTTVSQYAPCTVILVR